MADFPTIKRFRTEDFPEIDEKFLSNLNTFTESVVNALSGNINFKNILGDIYERTLITRNTSITADRPLKLSWKESQAPSAVICGGLWQRGASKKSSLNLNVTIEWEYDADSRMLLIKKINGLSLPSASAEYEITIICFCK